MWILLGPAMSATKLTAQGHLLRSGCQPCGCDASEHGGAEPLVGIELGQAVGSRVQVDSRDLQRRENTHDTMEE
jgi:hypothetical protein